MDIAELEIVDKKSGLYKYSKPHPSAIYRVTILAASLSTALIGVTTSCLEL